MDVLIDVFNPVRHSIVDIAGAHLAIRQEQEVNGENDFSNILDSQEELSAIEEFYINKNGAFFVGLCDGKLAGFVGLKHLRDSPKVGEIKRLAVVKDFRGRGVATQLSAAAKQWAIGQKFDHLVLRTNTGERASGVYEKLGFAYVGYVRDSKDYEMALSLAEALPSALLEVAGLPKDYSLQILACKLQIPKGESPKNTICKLLLLR